VSSEVLNLLAGLSPAECRRALALLSPSEAAFVSSLLDSDARWGRWADDPVRFVTEGLGETLWSKQREILLSLRDNKRTAVPACHAPGKSHLAARAVAWWVCSHPPGTARVLTTASTFRQVRNVLWPHIRRVHQRHKLPGDVLTVEWRVGMEMVADGFSPADHDETAVQGVHAPHLLVVVDEAGGIGATLGRALEALMTGGHTRLLVLGNPPVDSEGTWFERICESPLYNVISIAAADTPNFTGEDAGECKACPADIPPHPVSEHLVDQTWVDDVVTEFGGDSSFVEARVHARFPRAVANKVIPLSWCEQAAENESPAHGLEVRLGVDVAADGGDEFAIAFVDGFRASVVHRSSGEQNANAVDVAGVILGFIEQASVAHRDRGLNKKVRVKVDATGLGWGVVSLLQRWGQEGRHEGQIVPVNVGERAGNPQKFANQRAEMWWNCRQLLQPAPNTGAQELRLDVDRRTLAQIASPQYKTDSSGRLAIEKKSEMKRRGIASPDRAEAILLALYEPPGSAPLIAPISFGQANRWQI
jgi:hypothetical protein